MSFLRSIKACIFREKASHRRETRKRFLWGLAVLIIAWVAQLALQMSHFFDNYDRSDADFYAQAMPLPPFSDRITLVTIDDDDYRSIFNSHSPLPYESVLNLIETVDTYQPKVIGLDIITADWPTPAPKQLLKIKSPIVWARDGQPSPESDSPKITWNGVAGYSEPPRGLCFAAPSFEPDSDGTVRRYSETLTARESNQSSSYSEFPTMSLVLASIYPDKALNCGATSENQNKLIRFTGSNHRFMIIHASDLLTDAKGSRTLIQYLRNRIILIGGTYTQGRDRYSSSEGYLYGIELNAHATESEISGALSELSPARTLAMGAIVSIFAYFVVFRFRYPVALIASILLFFLFSFPIGWLAYRFGNLLIPIASSLLALPIGIICEHIVECPLRDICKDSRKGSQVTR